MKIRETTKLGVIAVGITLAAISAIALSAFPWSKTGADCPASGGQTVVKWKDQRWPCRHWWSIRCRRRHSTYKITLHEGVPLRDENGRLVVMASGRISKWAVYDSRAWNGMKKGSWQRESYPDYEPIAEKEYVVMVQTRYRLFHKVEASLRICAEKP